MTPDDVPMRCLAVSVRFDADGDIDNLELAQLLDGIAGPGHWMTTTEWLFINPPAMIAGEATAPVAVPESVAVRAILNDLTNAPQRILCDHAMTPAEMRKWRWAAFQVEQNPEGRGRFPWEPPHDQ